jgi:hypothetical protein
MNRLYIAGIALLFATTAAQAQFDQVKTYLMLNQLPKAKEAIQDIEKKGKATTKPEFHLAKATVLAGLMKTVQGDEAEKYMEESMAEYRKYLAADAATVATLLQDPAYAATAFTYYSVLFNRAISHFNAKKYADAAKTFGRTVEWSDYLIKNKQLASEFDTTLFLYAGATSQMSEDHKGAIGYYEKIAARKIGGKDFLDVYKYMTYMYFLNKETASFEKSKALGKELYPKEEMFKMEEIDFILEVEDEKDRMARLEAKMAAEPDNAKLQQMYGGILFDKLSKRDVDPTTPEFAADEQKMLAALTKTAAAMPEDGMPNFLMGKHQWYKAERIRNLIADVNDEIRKFNDAQKPDKMGKTPPPPKELTARRDSLRRQQEAYMDIAVPFLLKAQPLLAQSYSKVKGGSQNYKLLVDDLIQYYGFKRQYAKLPADKAKAEAEEKKWDKVYSEITQ